MMIDFDREKSLPLQKKKKRRQHKHCAFFIKMNGGTETRNKMWASESGKTLPLSFAVLPQNSPQKLLELFYKILG